MAHTPRRRALVAASALSLALTAPSIVVPNGYAQDTTTTETTATSAAGAPDSAVDWEKEYAANFAGNEPATVEGLVLPEGSTIEAAAATLFNWKLAANEDGSVELTRPQSDVAFRDGLQSIPAKVTLPGEEQQNVTLKVNVSKNDAAWVADLPDLDSPYDVDFEGKLSKTVDEITLPEGVTVKKGAGKPLWGVSTKDGKVLITAPSNFVAGTQDLPVEFSDGTTTVKRTLKINASNPQTSSGEVAGIAGDVLGKILGGIVGGATGGGLLGGLTGGGSGSGTGSGSGDGKGGGVNINIASNNGNPNVVITDNAKAEIKDNLANNGNPVITDNAKAEIKDNLSNNGNPVITDNAKAEIKDNLSNNGNPVITDNAKATVEIKDNLSNNGNPDVKISDNAKATVVITDNANPRDNLSNNGNPDVKISDNAKATVVITDNAKADIKDNAKATVVITDNANPRDNLSNNGNPDVKISDNAKADVKVTDNAKADVNVTDNGNPDVKISDNAKADVKVTDNAKADVNVTDNGNPDVKVTDNGKVDGIPASSGGGSSAFGQEGEGPEVGANVGVEGGSSDPRCAATLAGLAVPILAIIPLALATQLTVPGLESVGAQLTRTLNDAARNFGVQPEALTAAGAGVIGLATAVLAIVGARTCVPSVRDVDITVGSSGSGETPSTTSTVAPVVKTD
ncbi:hypothetical protein CKJ85_09100 [Corynebacterium sp. NML 150383]|uniref:right-handed parallel beta-helix repeat-containing protein n=1 Tax=Corynebacterium sp. NML 150383 TaxID=2029400 RepID=UPI000BAA4115|nr:right-handed parallel beta-helix repeat-containing protein [Corynebacterium sp. NML 150383]PAT03135.1 hypothetical protein CKJ85_09100 [Corynebacterium sp. NML 150383]